MTLYCSDDSRVFILLLVVCSILIILFAIFALLLFVELYYLARKEKKIRHKKMREFQRMYSEARREHPAGKPTPHKDTGSCSQVKLFNPAGVWTTYKKTTPVDTSKVKQDPRKDTLMTTKYTAADFADADFARHPDGRKAHRVNDVDWSGVGDFTVSVDWLAANGFAPVEEVRNAEKKREKLKRHIEGLEESLAKRNAQIESLGLSVDQRDKWLAEKQDELDATTAEPKPFATDVAFKDIRKGDRVRSTISDHGVTRTNVGVVHHVEGSGNFWMTERGGVVVANRYGPTIDILERPTPTLPNTPGSLIEVINGDSPGGRNISGSVLALNGLGHWWTLDGETVVEPSGIREWRLLKTVPADVQTGL